MTTHTLRTQLEQAERASLRDLFQAFWAKTNAEQAAQIPQGADEYVSVLEIEKRARQLRAEWLANQRVFSGE